MNRYGRSTVGGGSSKATATTLCQKCLKRGHYSYECKSAAQERPYVSRPSRTQQLQNPKLIPKLTSDVSQDLLRKKGIADEQLAKAEELRNKNKQNDMGDEDESFPSATKRMRSESVSTVSTISTGRSESPQRTKQPVSRHAARSSSPSNKRAKVWPEAEAHQDSPMRDTKPDIIHGNSDMKRRRDSVSSYDSYSSEERDTKERSGSRNTRRRYQEHSPIERGRRTESRSPQRGGGGRRRFSDDRPARTENRRPSFNHTELEARTKERSLSPFSKRLALTQARNSGL